MVTRVRLSKAAAQTAATGSSTDAPDGSADASVAHPDPGDQPDRAGQSEPGGQPGSRQQPSLPGGRALAGGAAPDRSSPVTGGTSGKGTGTGPGAELALPSVTGADSRLPIHPSQTRPFQTRPIAPSTSPNADRWLRRGMAAVGVAIVAAAAIGSAVSDDDHPQPTQAAGPSAPPPTVIPTDAEPTPPPPVLADDPGTAPAPTASGMAKALAARLADPRLGGRISAQVVDVGTGAVLFDRGGGALATPASTAKVLTAAALLSVRQPDDRLATRVVAGAKPGEVVLVGGGDATLSAAAPGRPTSFAGAGRVSDLAAQVKKTSPGKVTKVLVDGSQYSGPRTAPGWDPGDVAGGYVAPMTALMTDVGRTDPANTEEQAPRFSTPDLAAGRAFAARLGLPASAVSAGTAKAGATVLAEVRSAPIARLVEQMLLESDNVLAEALARQVAVAEGLPASFAGSVEAVRRVLGRIGVPTGGLRLLDGSGLSGQDKVTPAALVAVLRAVASVDHPALHALVPGLPVSGYDGTLDERYVRGPAAIAAGSVRAKTGTLAGVSSLAGIVADKDGRLLVFAFLADRVDGSILDAEDALDESAAALVRCGCR